MAMMAGPEKTGSVCEVTISHWSSCDVRPRLLDGLPLDPDPFSPPRDCRTDCPGKQARLNSTSEHGTRNSRVFNYMDCRFGHTCCRSKVFHDFEPSSGCTCESAYKARHIYVEKPLQGHGVEHRTWYPPAINREIVPASTSNAPEPKGDPETNLAGAEESQTSAASSRETSVVRNFHDASRPTTPEATAAGESSPNAYGATRVRPELLASIDTWQRVLMPPAARIAPDMVVPSSSSLIGIKATPASPEKTVGIDSVFEVTTSDTPEPAVASSSSHEDNDATHATQEMVLPANAILDVTTSATLQSVLASSSDDDDDDDSCPKLLAVQNNSYLVRCTLVVRGFRMLF